LEGWCEEHRFWLSGVILKARMWYNIEKGGTQDPEATMKRYHAGPGQLWVF